MISMAVNKVVYGTTVLVDLTGDTVTADGLLLGLKAHGANGEAISGTLVKVDLEPYADIETGSITLSENTTSFAVDTSKGEPAFISIVCVNKNGMVASASAITAVYWTEIADGTVVRVMNYYSNSKRQATSNSYGTYSNGVLSLNYQLKAGWTYNYCVMYK